MAHQHLSEMFAPSKKPFEEDFIMLSEFSEQEGPKPLLTIPRDAGGTFDKNSFAVRIMAVDFQTGAPGAFEETKDTQVVLSEGYDPATKVYAFVYHLTLHDIHARGYVRPFCMAYLTMDERKILLHFEDILQEFTKVSEVLKHGNWPIFEQELIRRVSDLEHTRDELVSAQNKLDEEDTKQLDQVAYQLEQCTGNLEEIRNILSVVQVLVGRNSELDAQVSRFEELFESHRLRRPASETNILASTSIPKTGVDDDDDEGGSSRPRKRSNTSPPQPEAVSADAVADLQSVYQPQTLDVLRGKRFDQKLRSLKGLCGVCSKLALGHLRRILNHYGRDHEGVAVENEEFHCLEPQSALLTVGRRVVLNFLNGIDRCCAQCEWPLSCGATTWRLPVFYRSQSALTVSSWGEMSFKSCVEELSGLEDATCTPPLFQKESLQFFDATDGSGMVFPAGHSGSGAESARIGSHDDMHSLPQSDQSNEDVRLDTRQANLDHVPSPSNKVIGWLSKAGSADESLVSAHDVANQPPDTPSSQGMASPADAALTSDSSSQLDPDILDESNPEFRSLDASAAAALTAQQDIPRQPQAPAIFHSPSSPSPAKRTPSFWDEPEEESVDHPVGLIPRQEPGGDSDDESITPANPTASTLVTTTATTSPAAAAAASAVDGGNNVYTGFDISQAMSRSPDTVRRDNLVLALEKDLPSGVNLHREQPKATSSPVVPRRPFSNEKQQMKRQHEKQITALPKKQKPTLLPLAHTCIRSYSDDLCHLQESTPGYGLLKFRDRYVFAVHLVYALLRGRPVVVLGKTERDVVSMVRTLSVFVPGHSSQHQIIEWFAEPLNISHLSRIKLIGIRKGRLSMVPQSVKPYVSILDYDTSTLTTPPYKGNFVSNIVHRQKKWMDDRSYLAHIHSVFLQMGCKAFLYFHNFCLNIPLHRRERNSRTGVAPLPDSSERFAQSRTTKSGFLTHLGISECDRHIIEYFVDVVKMQQMDQFRHSNNMDGDDYPPTIRLDHSKCSVYQGRRPVGRFS
ncbi:uncharacterized protein LOC135816099 isoform X2 [Sycon ciliatum]|uniref:uncharacterized protein LOC135816099 isoform X2 n=1 Tax=Sycon ciliatum TaxID=27933 RepID=UPI0020A98658|eukprot:scpid22918/ scgid15019/ Smith-Magenis syndrome chromosomal region candidate gene 8 protein homolog